ncbi:S1/P1 nuclease [uncultured Maricaulis sp.]|uniref:S1/P1 nuclease n=1 Tax=uncultured Maricaulis sp. TaxID=174710 RepID=UPI0030DD9157|tara:strand:+ start:128865 stop:129764 length:900 start_codon:yes stop_codon:yes gene_type:complete
MSFLRALVAGGLAAAALSVSPAAAYGPDGHRIVCDLAYRYLSDEARTEVDRLVMLDPEFENFRDICSWADAASRSTHEFTRTWHYINQDRNDPQVDAEDCAEDGCITSAISLHAGVFLDRARTDAERLEALKFLAHWLGDIHQPMHVSIEGDRGGNDIEVLWRGERHTNFHRVWDSEIILDYMSEQWGWAPEATRWSYFADELASEIPLNGVDILTPLDPIAWAQESHDIVRSRDFAYYWARAGQMIEPGDAYYQRGLRISRQELKQGGVRLAGLLNDLVAERRLAALGGGTQPAALDD